MVTFPPCPRAAWWAIIGAMAKHIYNGPCKMCFGGVEIEIEITGVIDGEMPCEPDCVIPIVTFPDVAFCCYTTAASRMIAAMREEIPLLFDADAAERLGDAAVRELENG